MQYVQNFYLNFDYVLPYLSSYFEVLELNLDIKPHSLGFCHLDLHLKNIVLDANLSAYIIDLENICITDVWRDFTFATTFYESELEMKLWHYVFHSYFHNDIPDEFWSYNFVYSIIKMLQMCMFEQQRGNADFANKISSDFYHIYGGLKDTIPIHFR